MKTNPVTLQTTQDADFEQRLQETARMSGVPVDRLREMVNAFNASVFTPPPVKVPASWNDKTDENVKTKTKIAIV